MKSIKLKNKVNKLIKGRDKIMLNVGCGTDYKDGWINIDNNSESNIDKLDLNWDLRNPLPFEDGTIDYIFNEHFFEHLTPQEAEPVIQDLMRVLKPKGVMRIAMPDLEMIVETYLHIPLNKDITIKRFKLDSVKTPAEWMNMSFRFWEHKWIYDFVELKRRVEEAGYKKVTKVKLGKSTHPELRNLEIRPESHLVVEVVK
jgi:predicted SAM-dependent methyltransferase